MTTRLRIAALPVALLAFCLVSGCSMLHHEGTNKVQAAALPLTVVSLPTSVYNLADPTPAYLRLGVSLGMSKADEKDGSTVQSVARDTLVSLVTAQTSAVLLTSAGKAALKKSALAEMQHRLPDAGIQDLYFDEFLVQH